MARGATWSNDDGLVVGFGTHSEDNEVAAVTGSGTRKTLKRSIVGTSLSDTYSATDFLPQEAVIPRGSVIIRATVTVITAFTGSSSTLDIGTFTKGLATDVVDDADGIVADMTIAELTNVGEVHICDGGLIATAGTTAVGAIGEGDCVVAPSWETAAFTAGEALLTVEYIEPFGKAGRTIAAVD